MSRTITPAPVRRSVTVNAPRERAFETFTAGFGTWWPASHSIGSSPIKSAILEPRAGGRWYEIGEDGRECEWGEVLAWDPPERIVLAWRIGADWKYDPALLTEVEVRFIALPEGKTSVELEHRLLENYGAQAEGARGMLDSEGGWTGVLAAYAQAADKSSQRSSQSST